jgi:acyl carrier protein
VTIDAHLHDDLDLDSLELAELSVLLEDNLGRDPYTEGIVPNTVGEIVAFYG